MTEDERKKAQRFFNHGRSAAATGNYDYAIEMFLTGLSHDPDDVAAHKELRDFSMRRKASGGKGLGMMDAMKLKKGSKDEKINLLNAEKLLAYDPGNSDHMLAMAQAAAKLGCYDTALWIGPLTAQAEADGGKPDAKRFLALRDVYNSFKQWGLALEMVNIASRLRPMDMDLQTEARSLAAQRTMKDAGYDKQASFREQVKDMESQLRLLDSDKASNDPEILLRQIAEAEKQLAADPNEVGKLNKLVDALVRTELPANEERAVKLLQDWYDRTKEFRCRQRIGQIRMKQMQRQERQLAAAVGKASAAVGDDPEAKKAQVEFRRKLWEFELSEYTLFAQGYPNDLTHKFEMGKRQFLLKQFDEAITSFQQARNDPRYRVDASVLLARAFFDAGFLDEADETLGALIRDAAVREGPKFMDMNYWRGRVLEQKGQTADAIKHYSLIFQLDSSYRDVSARIKRLRAAAAPQPPPSDENQTS